MSYLLDRLKIIEEAIEVLPNFEWTTCGNSIQNTTEFENMMDNVSEHIQELKRFSNKKEISDELDTLRRLFNDYSVLANLPLEREKVLQTMKEIMNKLKRNFSV